MSEYKHSYLGQTVPHSLYFLKVAHLGLCHTQSYLGDCLTGSLCPLHGMTIVQMIIFAEMKVYSLSRKVCRDRRSTLKLTYLMIGFQDCGGLNDITKTPPTEDCWQIQSLADLAFSNHMNSSSRRLLSCPKDNVSQPCISLDLTFFLLPPTIKNCLAGLCI